MPLLTVPDPVPFIAVTKAVFAHRARAERRQLEWALRTQRALTAAAVAPGGLLGILAAHRAATGRAGVVIDLLGRVLAESDPGGERLVAAAGRAARLGARAGPGRGGAWTSPAGAAASCTRSGARRLRAWLLIDGPAEPPAAHQLSGDLVSLLSLELERRHGLDAAQRRGRAQVLDRLARAAVDDVVAARWLAAVGPARRRPAGGRGGGAGRRRRTWPPTCVDHAAGRAGPGGRRRWSSWPRRWASTCPGCWPRWPPTGRPGSASGCGRGRWPCRCGRPARRCRPAGCRVGTCTPARSPAAGCCSARSARRPCGPTPTRCSARWTRPTGPTELVRALAAFLEHNGHWGAAADALRVHRHTMRNRIDAVERLTGRRLESAQDRHELWLALRARETARMSTDPGLTRLSRPAHAVGGAAGTGWHHRRGARAPVHRADRRPAAHRGRAAPGRRADRGRAGPRRAPGRARAGRLLSAGDEVGAARPAAARGPGVAADGGRTVSARTG